MSYFRGGSNHSQPDAYAAELLAGLLADDAPKFYPSDYEEAWRGGVDDDDEAPGRDLDSVSLSVNPFVPLTNDLPRAA